MSSLKIAAMAGKIKTVDGAPLTADKFAYVGDPQDPETWHLPLDTHGHVNSALDMFAHTDLPSSAKAPTARKIVAKAREENLDTTDFVKNHLSSQMHGETPRPWFEIFRAGDYTKAGKGVITPDDLKRVVRNYDPTYHEAPETLGHRSDDQPAYGWIDGLMLDGDKLMARERQVDPKFDEARTAGKFKKRSAAFYTDENGQVTGLRHLAWLGAGIPEVKGLQDVAFDDHGSKFITVDFGEEIAVADKTLTEQVKEAVSSFFAELSGKTAQPKTFSEDDVKRVAVEAATAAAAPLQAKVASLEEDLKTQTTKFAERENALAGGEIKQRATAAVARLKGNGKWVPAFEKMGLSLVFDELAKVTTTVEFGEGDAKKKVTPLETLVLFLEGLPQIVPTGRTYTGDKPIPGKGATGDPLTDAAKAYEKEHKVSFSEALDKVSAEHPEWTGAGVAAGGVV
jgi:hypothetical protein